MNSPGGERSVSGDSLVRNFVTVRKISSDASIDVAQARDLLATELNLAYAPVTGKNVVCLIQTNRRLYTAHNYEHTDPISFDHAEERALEVLKDEPIQRVFMAGRGHEKIKQVSPCSECYDALAPHFSPRTELILFQPDTLDTSIAFSYAEHQDAYSPKPYSAITGRSREETVSQLKDRTLLQGAGLEFVADLRQVGLDTGINFYLTGSASGRGWMGQQVHLKQGTSYRDMDIVAVTETEKDVVEEFVENALKPHFGELDKRRTTVDVWFIGEVRQRANYYSNDKEIVDLSVAPTLRGGMIRMDYLRKNFFHQLS